MEFNDFPHFHNNFPHFQLQNNFQLPKIPVLPISYSDALQVLKRMGGDKVPAEWQGGIKTDYRLGPGLRDGALLQLDVHSSLEKRSVKLGASLRSGIGAANLRKFECYWLTVKSLRSGKVYEILVIDFVIENLIFQYVNDIIWHKSQI